jgi:hypothetical protein
MARLLRHDEKTKIASIELSLQSIYDVINGLNMLVSLSEKKIYQESDKIDREIDLTKLERYRQLLKEFHKIKNDSISKEN